MDFLSFGPLHVHRFVKTTGTTPKNRHEAPLTVVLMHGYGAPGDDLASLGEVIDAPSGTTFLFPEAPHGLLGDAALMTLSDEARAWWQIEIGRYQRAIMQGTIEQLIDDVPNGIVAARESVIAMLDCYERETSTPGDRIVLGGFSQGSMLALDVALQTSRSLAGLVLLSGSLIASRQWLPLMAGRKDLPVFQSHGTEDPILPYPIAERLRDELANAGMRMTFTSFEDGHGIPPEVYGQLGAWLHHV